jgi:hypothetical protein
MLPTMSRKHLDGIGQSQGQEGHPLPQHAPPPTLSSPPIPDAIHLASWQLKWLS